MPKDNRVILTGVVIGGRTFVGNEEDELEEAMTPEQLAHLTREGAIAGDWKARGGTTGEEQPNQPKKLDRMNNADLVALAKEKQVEIKADATNSDIRNALRAAGVEG